jgi:hypothetical protein
MVFISTRLSKCLSYELLVKSLLSNHPLERAHLTVRAF